VDRLRGLVPNTQDAVAIVILALVYLIRIAATGPAVTAPWYLLITTDLIIPLIAATWLYVSAFFALLYAVGRA